MRGHLQRGQPALDPDEMGPIMNRLRLLGDTAIRSFAGVGIALALAIPAYAQDATTPAQAAAAGAGPAADANLNDSGAAATGNETIVVTGTRIRALNLESVVPVATLSGEQFFQQGQTSIGEILNELPQLRNSFGQQNVGLGVGVAGLNLLDLRGLGTSRTLVLVNGRRHVPADILNNAVSPDVNTIPADLVDRVDITTGANSAVYGSDAIAGVVNFILKRNFQGFQMRGQVGVSEGGYGGNQYVSAMAGTNFGEGRGNIILHGEYSRQERVFASNIPFLNQVDGLAVTDTDGAGLTNNSDGIPDRTFIRNQTQTNINRNGLVFISQPASNPRCGVGANGVPFNCTYLFQNDGTLIPQTGTRFGTGVLGGIAGGNGQTGREADLVSILPKVERYNANLLAHYEFSPALEAFVEAKYVRVNVAGSNAGPTGIQGQFTQFDARERPRLDNPFLNAAARTTITDAILASGCNPGLSTSCATNPGIATGGTLTAAQRTAIANGSFRFGLARNLLDVSIRDENFKRETFRIVGGLRGTFNDDWSYEFSANYGQMKENTNAGGYVDRQRFALSIDAGRNPATGQIQCRAQFDPASATAYPNNAGNQARLAADIAACVPYNPFGTSDNSAARSYFSRNYTNDSKITQLVLTGFVNGDLSQLFELPGGPISFALGGEYRREKPQYAQDEFGASGNSTAVAFGTFNPPAFKVKEAFAELRVPLLSETPFFEELTLTGAGRVSDYQGGTGTVYTYNVGGEWAPVRDIRFRANYGRAIRAPNRSETGTPLVPNFAPAFTDPCTTSNINSGTQFRNANCRTDLGTLLPNIASLGSSSLPILSGSNPDLQEEKSNSLTIGGVLQPRFVPGLSLSVDYFDIKVDGVIVSSTAQQIVNNCYDSPTLANPFCDLFQRFRGTGTGPFGEVAGAIQGNTLISSPLNFAKRVRRGIDFQASYRSNIFSDVRLSAQVDYTHQLKNSNFENPIDPNFENRLLGELGDPVDSVRGTLNLTKGAVTFGYQVRYIGSMYVGAYENYNALQDRAPQDADYSEFSKYPDVFYHDFRVDFAVKGGPNATSDLNFYVGIDNAFNRNPPLGLTGTGERVASGGNGSNIYLIRGRNFYAGARVKF
jgi:outer membrane receptor protein involved in Fe transport